jgi:hypothetical protein
MAESVRELRLEIVGYTDEALVEPPELQHYIAPYRKISAHEILDPRRPNCRKVEALVVREISTHLPWLNNAPSHERRASLLQRAGVRPDQSWIGNDVII